MKVKALKNARYAGKVYKAGEVFDHKDPKEAIAAKIVEQVESVKKQADRA